MLIIYLVVTCGLFLGWIRYIPKIEQKPWLANLFLLLAFCALLWGCVKITQEVNKIESDYSAFMYLGFYFIYIFAISVALYKVFAKRS